MTPSQLTDALQFFFANKFPVLIKGKPGIGKTDLVAAAAAAANAELIISHPVVSDPTDFKGLPFAANGEADFLLFGDLRKLIEATVLTVFFIDDIGQATAAVQAACMQLLLAREINGKKISDYVTFAAATNRKEDKAGVSGILEPVKSRFASIVELEVTTEDWVRWALTTGNIPTELISFIRFRPTLLDDFKPSMDIVNSPCPRTVARVGQMQNAGVPKGLEFEVFKGAVGEGFAIEYTSFLKLFTQLPNIDQILMTGDGDVPTDPGILYATSGAIAARITNTNAGNAFKYLDKLPVEIGVACVKDTVTRQKSITQTRAFIQWASDKGNLIFN